MEAYRKGTSRMLELFLSVGIDVGADFSFMSIALPNQSMLGKPFKITHSNLHSLSRAVTLIREAAETHSLPARVFLESTGIYHYPLMHYFKSAGFAVSVINPIITKSKENSEIRKTKNDKLDSKKMVIVGNTVDGIEKDRLLSDFKPISVKSHQPHRKAPFYGLFLENLKDYQLRFRLSP
jgi:hypothetical protein